MGADTGNGQPARVVVLPSAAAKERLRLVLPPGNVAKVMSAPITAILGYDTDVHKLSPRLWPRGDVRSWYEANPRLRETTALRNGTLHDRLCPRDPRLAFDEAYCVL